MQTSFSVNNVAIVNGRPRTLNLKELLQAFMDHRHEVVTRRHASSSAKPRSVPTYCAKALIIAEQNIDEVIQIIKRTPTLYEEARANFQHVSTLQSPQTLAIVEMKLRSLTKLEQDKLRQQYADLERLIEHLNLILKRRARMPRDNQGELLEIRDKYGDARKTTSTTLRATLTSRTSMPTTDMIITISHLRIYQAHTA